MKCLLDTCTFLWIVGGHEEKLNDEIIEIFEDKQNDIFFSLVSAWEISIKTSIGKLKLGRPVDEFLAYQIAETGILILPISLDHVLWVADLPFHHKDPFDRLLISQAIVENMVIISSDSQFRKYDVVVRP
jgi:PIN domain nuclease of toxin-antitoxin system